MKIVKKINHDSLWVKAVRKDKTWFKVTVNRSGLKTSSNMTQTNIKVLSTAFEAEYAKYSKTGSGLNYGDLINNCETAFESIN
jgi:hypothetical protein